MLSNLQISQPVLTPDRFQRMVIDFRKAYFEKINFDEKIVLHREPMIYLNEKLQELYDYMNNIGSREIMRDIYGTTYGYVQAKIEDLWKSDKRLKSLYNTIFAYCELRNKAVMPVATAIAEYRALYRVKSLIIRKQLQFIKQREMTKPSPKHFELEIRKVYDNEYLKVFLRDVTAVQAVASHLGKLESVRRANVSDQKSGKRDITVYPAKAYDISETKTEVEASLNAYFSTNPNDPVFKSEPISSISDKAYEQIINYISQFGKNLESQRIELDEEGYRNLFVSHLNALSDNYRSKGEVYNRAGKTDILVFDKGGKNAFIAECKLWNGKKYLMEAIDQLLEKYVNWRDEKTAIIIFNREHKKFTDLIETAVAAVTSHRLCQKSLGQRTDCSFSFHFSNPQDAKKTIKLELILFNFT